MPTPRLVEKTHWGKFAPSLQKPLFARQPEQHPTIDLDAREQADTSLHPSCEHDITSFDCHGHDLRGCPFHAKACYETRSDRTWKRGTVWVFVCGGCAQKLVS